MQRHYRSIPSGFPGEWPTTFLVGREVMVETPEGSLVFTITGVDNAVNGRTERTIIGTVPWNGFRAVRARLWLRSDDRWFLGVSLDHLSELEARGHEDEDEDADFDDVIQAR